MSFQRRIQFFLVHTLFISNKEAQQLIQKGAVLLDGHSVTENCIISETSEIMVNGEIKRAKTIFTYLKFYKPRGFQSSLNPAVPNNLSMFFTAYKNLAIAGRLDKESEGLLLLSNDGKWVEEICHPTSEKEKEYVVTLNKTVTDDFITEFKNGVKIGGYQTKPCKCEKTDDRLIKVILTEGKNRQIRRMCKTLGYEVIQLKRVRIADVFLQEMVPEEIEAIHSNKG
ncbi:MAG: pseudouridine synthase [Bacteroidia bacterium]|nr:pseudouridine synthase [Bacteroidia bacterium]